MNQKGTSSMFQTIRPFNPSNPQANLGTASFNSFPAFPLSPLRWPLVGLLLGYKEENSPPVSLHRRRLWNSTILPLVYLTQSASEGLGNSSRHPQVFGNTFFQCYIKSSLCRVEGNGHEIVCGWWSKFSHLFFRIISNKWRQAVEKNNLELSSPLLFGPVENIVDSLDNFILGLPFRLQ